MIRSVLSNLEPRYCKRQFASRNIKVYKFLPVQTKNFPGSKETESPIDTKIDKTTVELLEQISLIGIESKKGIQVLEDAIKFAEQIFNIDTTEVKPLVSVLEDESLFLREDVPKIDVTRSELISHSEVSEENYYITPAGSLSSIP